MSSLLTELRRRNVFKVGFAYLVLIWLVVQITDTVVPPLGLPEWTLPFVIWLGVAGFPFALLFAWAFELTPDGVKRTEDVSPDKSITRRTSVRLNAVIIAMMAAVIVVLLIDRFWLQSNDGTGGTVSADLHSIAVLPFANLSDDPENEFFGDGLAEELLNQLAHVDGLKVAARTSSFYFKGKNPSLAEVAEALGVDTIVEGSVRRSGETIRVVVQLIAADTNAHLWSEKYDRPMGELFAMQDDIANQIIAELMPHLPGADRPTIVSDTGNISPAVFEQFLLARQRYHDGTKESMAIAKDRFLVVTDAAPSYAPAWAWLARAWIAPGGRGESDLDETRHAAQEAINKALALDPNQPMAYVAQGNLSFNKDEYAEAIENYDRAIELDSNLVDAYIARQDALLQLGEPGAAIESLQLARTIDPLHPEVLEGLAHLVNLQGQRYEAIEFVKTLWLVNPTAAANLEVHLYNDAGDFARSLYLAEEFGTAGANTLAFKSMMLGMHEAPLIQQTEFWPVSLAVQGRRDEALVELEIVKHGESSVHFRADIEYRTLIVLEEFVTAKSLLWERWNTQDSENSGIRLDLPDKIMLAGLLRKFNDTERIGPVLQSIHDDVVLLSESHASTYHFFNGYYHLLAGNVDEGAQHLENLAANGDAGMGFFGSATMLPWLFEGDPRLELIYEQFFENRNAQIDVLKRLRSEGLTLEELREEYIAAGAAQ